jgi:hypothetical protein
MDKTLAEPFLKPPCSFAELIEKSALLGRTA